ncbi:methyltransferase domain-containing protein [Terrabacter sp. GCM10028922]|uniref:methyltransferase domain-containing protein n=1 Tax=Terrabacter sp. GCM10028922 TaxID=3273428 RepID=UPI003606402D
MQCDYFDARRCRSCALMGVPYAVQLADKNERCRQALSSVAPHVHWLEPFASPESAFRNKAKLVVGGRTGAVTVGILDADANGVDLRACGLHEEPLQDVIPRLADVVDEIGLEPYDVSARRGELKHLILTLSPTGEVMLRLVLRSRRHLALLESRLAGLLARLPEVRVVSVNLQPEHKAVLEGATEIVLTEQGSLPMPVNGLTLELRPNSFFQTNTAVAAGLYRQAGDWAQEVTPSAVLDLYCGVGGFALHCAAAPGAPARHVLGVEVSPEAVESARLTASSRGRELGDVAFRMGDATDVEALEPDLLRGPRSMVVVNPPRRGIGPDLAAWIEACGASHLVYSSCNVDSLARDLAQLPSFMARQARLFDMFPQTSHHEVILLLERQTHSATTQATTGAART